MIRMSKNWKTIVINGQDYVYGDEINVNNIITNFMLENFNEEWEIVDNVATVTYGVTENGMKFNFWEEDNNKIHIEYESF